MKKRRGRRKLKKESLDFYSFSDNQEQKTKTAQEVIFTKEKKFLGEISVEDLIKLFLHLIKYEIIFQILNTRYRREFLYNSTKELINKYESMVKLDDIINNVIELTYKKGANYIPVLDKDKKVVEVITSSSLINFLENEWGS